MIQMQSTVHTHPCMQASLAIATHCGKGASNGTYFAQWIRANEHYLQKYCQGTPGVVPMRANIRVSALNKGGSGDPGVWSIIGHARTRTRCIRYIYYRPQQITICWLWHFWLNSWCVGYQGLGDPLTNMVISLYQRKTVSMVTLHFLTMRTWFLAFANI
jgi:hypothetical protein